MRKMKFTELVEVFGKDSIQQALGNALTTENANYNYIRGQYETKKAYINDRITENRTPTLNTYLDLRGQLLDYEELPKIEKSAKKINRMAYQLLSLRGDKQAQSKIDLDQVRAVPIETLYEGQLRGSRVLSGLCPFHQERTPSFYIYTDTNSFHCFGCGKHGQGAIDFVIALDGLDFKDAVRRLA